MPADPIQPGAPSRGLWVEAWRDVLRRRMAVVSILCIGAMALLSVLAPVIASGHPLVVERLDAGGAVIGRSLPLPARLAALDWLLLIGGVAAVILVTLPVRTPRTERLVAFASSASQAGVSLALVKLARAFFEARDAPAWARGVQQETWFGPVLAGVACLLVGALWAMPRSATSNTARRVVAGVVALIVGTLIVLTWDRPPAVFDYAERARAGEIRVRYTLIPWSPAERPNDRDSKLYPPGTSADEPLAAALVSGLANGEGLTDAQLAGVFERVESLPLDASRRDEVRRALESALSSGEPVTREELRRAAQRALEGSGRRHLLGTDAFGQDVLSQMIHACRLAVSIGLVSTGIAVMLGVTIGALMGYFGGWVDLVLYRVVEIFMAVPLLFILIVAAGVLPRDTYMMMAIIGCFTWTGAARYTRAEFLKLRDQDFVQSARAAGLPLRSVLFRHMLPNGVTPVLVDSSFAVAFAIILEATLSYLGLGPADQASWGRLLAGATSEAGDFVWWLAIFPGLAIFGAALSYNLLGEALRDAIDPKRKKR